MVSVGWVILAFLMGGFAGLVALSLIGMASREDSHAGRMERAVARTGLGAVELDEGWMPQSAGVRKHSSRVYVGHADAR